MLQYPLLGNLVLKERREKRGRALTFTLQFFFSRMHACLLVDMKPVGVVVVAAAAAAERKQANLLEAKNMERKWVTNQLTGKISLAQ